MEQSRREFTKKAAIVTAGAVVATGTSVLAATGNTSHHSVDKNGVVKGNSNKKEILYRKTAAWEEYYKNAK